MVIKNVVVKKTPTPSGSTKSGSGFSNDSRLKKPSRPNISQRNSSPRISPKKVKFFPNQNTAQEVKDFVKISDKLNADAASFKLFTTSISYTVIIYIIQLCLALIALIGLGLMSETESNWVMSALNWVTFNSIQEAGTGVFLIGIAGSMICGLVTWFVAAALYTGSGEDVLGGFSILVISVCLVLLLCPIINLFPIMWLWSLYMFLRDKSL